VLGVRTEGKGLRAKARFLSFGSIVQPNPTTILPLLPCEVAILALVWAHLEGRLATWHKQLAAVLMGAHVVFALGLNYAIVRPVLDRFEREYGATMRAAARKLLR